MDGEELRNKGGQFEVHGLPDPYVCGKYTDFDNLVKKNSKSPNFGLLSPRLMVRLSGRSAQKEPATVCCDLPLVV